MSRWIDVCIELLSSNLAMDLSISDHPLNWGVNARPKGQTCRKEGLTTNSYGKRWRGAVMLGLSQRDAIVKEMLTHIISNEIFCRTPRTEAPCRYEGYENSRQLGPQVRHSTSHNHLASPYVLKKAPRRSPPTYMGQESVHEVFVSVPGGFTNCDANIDLYHLKVTPQCLLRGIPEGCDHQPRT